MMTILGDPSALFRHFHNRNTSESHIGTHELDMHAHTYCLQNLSKRRRPPIAQTRRKVRTTSVDHFLILRLPNRGEPFDEMNMCDTHRWATID
jgi:hypothetical protein